MCLFCGCLQSVEKNVPVEIAIVESRNSYSRWHEIMATGKYVDTRSLLLTELDPFASACRSAMEQ